MKSQLERLIPRFGAFAAVFILSLFACPVAAIVIPRIFSRVVRNFLFFWPQLALAPYGFMHPADDMRKTYLDGGWNYLIMGAFWLLIGLGLSWALRNKRISTTAIAAFPVVMAIGVALEPVLNWFDVGVYFEGP